MRYHDISDKSLKEFKELCEKEGIEYETEAEYKPAAQNLVGFVRLSLDMNSLYTDTEGLESSARSLQTFLYFQKNVLVYIPIGGIQLII
jgi:hypothetical protein